MSALCLRTVEPRDDGVGLSKIQIIPEQRRRRLDYGRAGDASQKLRQLPRDRASVERIASALTPVPGGVGPMTIAMLLVNTYRAYRQHLSTP